MIGELRFAVLGPVRAWRGDVELELGSPQQRAVLAALLLAEGRQVSLSALIDALWGADLPRSAVGTVRTYVSRLRQSLGADAVRGVRDVIGSVGDGYRVQLGSATLDLDVFLARLKEAQTARDAGTPARAVELLADALELWEGVPLAGIPGQYAESQRSRLAELHMAAVEERLAVGIDVGGHVAATVELQSLVAEHPLRERLSELLMLAMYRSGRQADALAVFERARKVLGDELGIDPGPALREMRQRILEMDETLMSLAPAQLPAPAAATVPARPAAPVVRPAQLPADLPAFTGRRGELARLNSLLTARTQRGPAVVITAIDGMAGIGKTALAVHWAHRVVDQFPDGQLYANLRGFGPSSAVMAAGEALRAFLDALGVAPQRIPDSLEAQAGLFRSLLNGRRVLVLLDNARDVEQVRPLLPASPGCLVVVTSRNELTGLVTSHDAGLLTVEPFSADEARDALARRLGADRLAAEPDAVRDIVESCAGLPLATAIVAARATVYRDVPVAVIASELRNARTRLDALSAHDTTTDVRAVFSWSYQRLSSDAMRLFRLLAVHGGPDFSAPVAASLAGLPATYVRPLLRELTSARLISEHRPGRFVSHDLLRVYAAELSAATDSDADRDAAKRRLLDHYLHTAHAANLLLRPHYVPAAPAAPRAGVTPEELGDYQVAMAWFTAERHVLKAAVRTAADGRLYASAWQLALTMQQFYQRRGYWHDWAATMRTALLAARAADDLGAQANVRRSLAGAYHFLGRKDEALAELERTQELFTTLGYSAEHAFLHSNFGTVLSDQGRYDEAIAHYWQAYDLYQVINHEKGQAAALEGVGQCHGQQGNHHLAAQHVHRAMVLYRRLGDRNGEANCWVRLGESQHRLGKYENAMNCYGRALALSRQLGNRTDEAEGLTSLGDSALAAGQTATARESWEKALVILDELQLPQAQSVRPRLNRLPGRPLRLAPGFAVTADAQLVPVPGAHVLAHVVGAAAVS
jgi:DNA-binding SARP family transcriptional activator/tetratricopeptide (TPR) repeat protein